MERARKKIRVENSECMIGERRNKKMKLPSSSTNRKRNRKKKLDKKVEPEGLTREEWRRVENQQPRSTSL